MRAAGLRREFILMTAKILTPIPELMVVLDRRGTPMNSKTWTHGIVPWKNGLAFTGGGRATPGAKHLPARRGEMSGPKSLHARPGKHLPAVQFRSSRSKTGKPEGQAKLKQAWDGGFDAAPAFVQEKSESRPRGQAVVRPGRIHRAAASRQTRAQSTFGVGRPGRRYPLMRRAEAADKILISKDPKGHNRKVGEPIPKWNRPRRPSMFRRAEGLRLEFCT